MASHGIGIGFAHRQEDAPGIRVRHGEFQIQHNPGPLDLGKAGTLQGNGDRRNVPCTLGSGWVAARPRVARLSEGSYPTSMGGMKGITIKLPEAVAQRLRDQARESKRSVAALIRDRLEAASHDDKSVYAMSADLAGSLSGRQLAATNSRKRSRRP